MKSLESYLMVGSSLLLLSVVTSKAIGRLGVPSLLVFLAIGMLSGSEGIIPILTGGGGFYFDNAPYAMILGTVALIYILFSGGLDTELKSIRPILRSGTVLSTLGVLITCGLTGWFTKTFLGFTWLEGLLLGAIVSSTDAAAVFTVLRGSNINLKGHIKPLLELESGSNDSMAVLLTIEILQLLTHKQNSIVGLIANVFQQLIIGSAMGYFSGKAMAYIINRVKLEFDGLYPVITLALIVFIYGVTHTLGGNGFLAVYLAGLILGNENFIHKKSLILFHDGIAWLMQIAMFLVLGLFAFPSRLIPVAGMGLIVSLFIIFIARPASVFLSLFKAPFNFKEKLMVSWVGLRGSVPIILAIYPLIAGIDRADLIFHLVFFIVLTSVLIQGTSIPIVAKLLKVSTPAKNKVQSPIEFIPTGDMKNALVDFEITTTSPVIGKTILEMNLPKDVLIVLIQRKGNIVLPKGGTLIEESDTLLILTDKENSKRIDTILNTTS